MVGATPRSLLVRDPPSGGRDSLGPAANRLPAPPMLIHICMQCIYIYGRGYVALTPRMRLAFGRARFARASSQPAVCAALAHIYVYATHVYMWLQLRRAHSSPATRHRAGATCWGQQPTGCLRRTCSYLYICKAYMYMAAATQRLLLTRDPPPGGRDSLGPATNRLSAPPMLIHIYLQHMRRPCSYIYICNAYIYVAAATPRSLSTRDPPSGGRDSLGPAANRLLAPPMLIHIYMQRINIYGRGYAALTPHTRPTYGRARLARASSEPAACAARAFTCTYATHIYIWPRLRSAHSSNATRPRAAATR